ncbi:hypothetical protein [Sulfodiicoccus acidiphilus]|uniref:hypothetical protein n=1 Tax=Sulfodiicoccus acidiphilus TaxID=1670455 RepID=UPI000F83924E|nr:hypothetical protein [Sulfodiicoccus acidiphilus]
MSGGNVVYTVFPVSSGNGVLKFNFSVVLTDNVKGPLSFPVSLSWLTAENGTFYNRTVVTLPFYGFPEVKAKVLNDVVDPGFHNLTVEVSNVGSSNVSDITLNVERYELSPLVLQFLRPGQTYEARVEVFVPPQLTSLDSVLALSYDTPYGLFANYSAPFDLGITPQLLDFLNGLNVLTSPNYAVYSTVNVLDLTLTNVLPFTTNQTYLLFSSSVGKVYPFTVYVGQWESGDVLDLNETLNLSAVPTLVLGSHVLLSIREVYTSPLGVENLTLADLSIPITTPSSDPAVIVEPGSVQTSATTVNVTIIDSLNVSVKNVSIELAATNGTSKLSTQDIELNQVSSNKPVEWNVSLDPLTGRIRLSMNISYDVFNVTYTENLNESIERSPAVVSPIFIPRLTIAYNFTDLVEQQGRVTGDLVLTVTNVGNGSAQDVYVTLYPLNELYVFPVSVNLGTLQPGSYIQEVFIVSGGVANYTLPVTLTYSGGGNNFRLSQNLSFDNYRVPNTILYQLGLRLYHWFSYKFYRVPVALLALLMSFVLIITLPPSKRSS